MLPKKLSLFLKNIFNVGIRWFLILITPGIVLFAIAFPFFAKAKSFECSTQYGPCSDQVNSALTSFSGKTIFTARREIKNLLRKDIYIKNMTVRFTFPDKISVDILIKKPSFCISTDNPQKFAFVDEDGVILTLASSCALPEVLTKPTPRIQGQKVLDQELFSLKIVRGVYEMYQVSTGVLNDNLTVELGSGIKVIFPVQGDSDALLGALRLIYTKIQKYFPGKYKEIDLRFDSPVLR